MKLRVLLLVLLVVVGSIASTSASVTDLSGTLYPGWNQIALHGVPIDPAPTSVFSVPISNGMQLSDNLYRWEGASQSQYMYDSWQPEVFGNMLLNEGYWLFSDAERGYTYSGLDDTDSMDIWISLPKAGWTMIGDPFSKEFPWASAKVTDGTVTVSMQVASKVNIWLSSTAYWFEAESQSQYDLGIPEDWPSTLNMKPKHGYWVNTNVDKLALILESEYAIP
jgi:hypothetical protein